MSASEQVQLMVNNVRHKKRDGSLFLMGERIAWCPEGREHFDITVNYADIKCKCDISFLAVYEFFWCV